MTALMIENLSKHYGGIAAVDHCSFAIEKGTIVSIIGPNGAGKTTMFNLISGFNAPDTGSVFINNIDVTKERAHRRIHRGLTRTFQAVRLFPEMTVISNMLLASKHMRGGLTSAIFDLPPWRAINAADTKRATGLLERVGVHDKAHSLARDLSYGQRKLVEIVRALMTEPEILLLDEPAAGVNRTTLQVILQLIRDLKKLGKTVVLIEHDMPVVMDLSDRIIVLDYGKIIADGEPEEVQINPAVLEAYLGKRKSS